MLELASVKEVGTVTRGMTAPGSTPLSSSVIGEDSLLISLLPSLEEKLSRSKRQSF